MTQQHTAIIVAPEVVHDFLASNFPDWTTQEPCDSIARMWELLEEDKLSENSDLVIISDTLYDDDEASFVAAVATFAPEAIVMILSYTAQDELIQTRVDAYAQANHLQEGAIEFINKDAAIGQIEEALERRENPEDFLGQAKRDADFAASHSVAIDVDTNQKVDTSKDGFVLTVTSPKGGSGKSTVALLTATMLRKASEEAVKEGLREDPLSVCVVDLDTFDGQLGFVLGQMFPTALNIAMQKDIFDAALVKNNLIYNERMGIHALLAPVRGVTAYYTDAKFYLKTIRMLKTMFDVVIIDTSVQHYDDLIKKVALPEADGIVVVTTLDIKSVKGLARWMNTATTPLDKGGHGVDRSKVGVVVNGSVENVGIGQQELYAAALKARLLVAIPLDTVAVVAAGNANRLEDILRHDTIGPAYFKLASQIAKPRNIVLAKYPPEEHVNTSFAIDSDPSGAPTERPRKKSFFGRK